MAMKLFYSPIHGFIHKVLVTSHEVGVWDQLEFVPVYPISDGYSIAAINPLHKVPTLALEDGTVLYGSQTVVEYLDSLSTTGHHLYPAAGPARWDALRRLALADTLFEVTVVMALEKLEKPHREVVFKWNWAKVVRAVDQMEEDAAKGFDSFDIGQASALHGLSYLDRQTTKGLRPPVPEGWNWRDGRPALTAWWDQAIQRPSVLSHFNKEYEGEDSAEYCQTKVAEVLRAQGKPAPDKPVPVPVDFVPPED
ncbi:MAG: glutathione S-transferase family protein [Rhodospirillaceae bacterium]